jgi:formiminotetrahydrofolate cyclodeaminase
MELLDLRLREFLEEVASERRTPGGGSVAALVTAAAAGLLAKVARASSDAWPEARGIVAQAESLRERVAPIAQLDAEEY